MAEQLFQLHGLSHLALNSSNMARTVEFYSGKLGLPLVKTMETPSTKGGQHFFFDVGNDECLAFFYYPNMPRRAVEVDRGIGGPSAPGLMHHVAFKVNPSAFDEYRRKLDDLEIKYFYMRHDIDGGLSADPEEPANDGTFAQTVYFHDPDGNVIEFCAWLPAYEQLGATHVPAGVDAVPREPERA